MLKTEELVQHYGYLKEAADSLKKATDIRMSPALVVLREKLYDEMEVVLNERLESIKNGIVELVGEEEANNIIKNFDEKARA